MSVTLLDLWLPIVLSGVAVFMLSFVMWMVLPHHRTDYGPVPDEGATMAHFGAIPRGQYMFPHCASPELMKDAEWMKRRNAGPSGILTILPRGPMRMGRSLLQSFSYNLVLTVIVAYLASMAFSRGAESLDVFRFTATAAFLGCAGALGWQVIWFFATWSSTLKSIFDGLIYGLATGAIFMLCWPA